MKSNAIYKKLVIRIALVVVLIIAMTITTYAYISATLVVANNTFKTGQVDIEIGFYNPTTGNYDGTSVFFGEKASTLMEPGGTYTTAFAITDYSTDPTGIFYKLYFDIIADNGLGSIVEVTIVDIDNNVTVADGVKITDLTSELVATNHYDSTYDIATGTYATTVHKYAITFHYPENEGNEGMDKTLSFRLMAEAVQSKNQDANNVEFD